MISRTIRRFATLAFIGFLFAAFARSANAQTDAATPAVTIDRDIQYVDGGVAGQRLDIYRAAANVGAPSAKPVPLIVWIHGGGWSMGSKSYCPAAMIVGAGYDVASIEYRFSSVAKFPAQIQDCQAAIRWLRAHHEQYGFDPDHIGVMGESAGGHLAALLGTTGDTHHFDAIGENKNVSDAVQAVCDCYGPSDFTTFIPQVIADKTVMNVFAAGFVSADENSTDLFKMLTGKKLGTDPATDANVSPITYVTAHAPPFLIVHGTRDNLVPVAQSRELADKLKAANDSVVLQIIPGASHGGRAFFTPQTVELYRNFFDHALKGADVEVKPIEFPAGKTTRP